MAVVTSDQFYGKELVLLGVSAPVNLAVATTNYPIFTAGEVPWIAPSGITFIQYVESLYNNGVGAVPTTLSLRFGNIATIATAGDWKNTFTANGFVVNPSVYAAVEAAPIYSQDMVFAVRVQAAAAAGNTAIFKAYGWCL